MRVPLCLLVLLLLTNTFFASWMGSPRLAAAGQSVYLHNRLLQGRWEGGEFYVPAGDLPSCLDAEESSRVQVDPARQVIQVGEHTLPYDGRSVPLLALARALGLRRVESNGVVDFVKVEKPGAAPTTSDTNYARRSEYREAARRMGELLKVRELSNDGPRGARIDSIGRKVALNSPLAGIPWKFLLVRDPAPNAACVGEGHVFVTTGLMDLGINDNELAGVLGHEIAHGVRRHTFRRVEMGRELRTLLDDYQRLRQKLAQSDEASKARLRAQVDEYERRRNSLQYRLDNDIFYTKVDEEEADVLGLRYAVLSGYSADGLGDCLKQLNRFYVETFGMAVLSEDLSHPPVKRRLEILEQARRHGGF